MAMFVELISLEDFLVVAANDDLGFGSILFCS